MKFILHEIKLWFNDTESSKNYQFLPNKVNVISGDATTGKTSFWSIIDYCLLSPKIKVANTINEKVSWFGICFTINDNKISIVRKTPAKGAVSADVFFNYGDFPILPVANKSIAEIKSILDDEFAINDSLRFPYGKNLGRTTFNLTYRHFLLFNVLTESIIGASETYFDTTFFDKDEYDKALNHIFDLVIGVNDMEKIKATERINEIDEELKKIRRVQSGNENRVNKYEKDIYNLIGKCKQHNFIEYSEKIEDVDHASAIIEEVIKEKKKKAINEELFAEIDALSKERRELQIQLSAINQYQKEFKSYQRNLNKSADSLQPIEFLNDKLSDQLVDSYETRSFINELEASLKEIKTNLSKKVEKPLKVGGNIKEIRAKINEIDKKLGEFNKLKESNLKEGEKFIVLGEIKYVYEQITSTQLLKPIDKNKLNELNDERKRLEKVPKDTELIKFLMKNKLNESIQRNYDQLKSLPAYKDYKVNFDEDEMLLKLTPPGEMFPLDNVGSKSNYMFMHLCTFLGLHEHMINIEQVHVPRFLFIDQPSIPYYTGDDKKGNDDKTKLIDAFTLLNSFIDFIVKEKKLDFQIFMVEHAPKDYWIENNLSYFHTVDEFINGKGLIPTKIYNNKD